LKRNFIFCSLILAMTSCAPGAKEIKAPEQIPKESALHEKTQPPPPLLLKGKLWLPTILHEKDHTVMVLINAGNPETSGEKTMPAQVQPFYMDQHEIRAKEFSVFDVKYDEKPHTFNHRPCPDCPAMGVDWFRANAYCQWAGKRLPTEAEWEFAAQGQTNNIWPWGNQFLPKRANLHGEEDGYLLSAPVGSFPQGASPYGVLDMIGNVWEWVANPVSAKDAKKTAYAVKGGGWTSSPESIKITTRHVAGPTLKNPTFGFRCAKSLD
jgi:formylglycine-generating enzyme required for sulfatase activity